MQANIRMKRIFLEGLLWLYLLEIGLTVLSLEPGFLDFDNLPDTNFTCVGKVIGGYYADLETNCQMFHVCTIGQLEEPMDIRFLCLNGTVFDQETRVCERIDEVDCSKSEQFYSLNLELYGNSQPILEESPDVPETEQPLVIKSTTTTTTTTTTRRPTTKPTKPPYFSTSILPTATSARNQQVVHHFPVTSSDIRFNPEEINISLNAGSPPDIRTNHFGNGYSDSSDSAKVQTSNQELKRPHAISSTTSRPVFSLDATSRKLPQINEDVHYDFTNSDYNTEYPQVFHFDSRHTSFLPHIAQDVYHNRQYQNKPHPSTFRPNYLQSLKPPDINQQHHYNTQTEKPPQRLQIPIPLLPTLPPLIFSSPAPFTLHRHVDSKRYTKEHQAPPRIIISASASVTDDSGRRLNYSLGTIGAAQILEAPPPSYDEYKDTDVGLDPFYHDVPKLKQRRRRRSADQPELNPFEVIRNEQEAVKVLKFLFTWYQNHQATATAPSVTIPVSPDLITKINHEFAPQSYSDDSGELHFISSRETVQSTTPAPVTQSDFVGGNPKESSSTTNEEDGDIGGTKSEGANESSKNNSGLYINPDDYIDDNYEPQSYKEAKTFKLPIQLPELEVLPDHKLETPTNTDGFLNKQNLEDYKNSKVDEDTKILINDNVSSTAAARPENNFRRRGRGRHRYSSRVSQQQHYSFSENFDDSLRHPDVAKESPDFFRIPIPLENPPELPERSAHRNSRKRGRSRFNSIVSTESPTSSTSDAPTNEIKSSLETSTEYVPPITETNYTYTPEMPTNEIKSTLETSTEYERPVTAGPAKTTDAPAMEIDQDSEQTKIPANLESNQRSLSDLANDTIEINLSSKNSANALQDIKEIFEQSEIVDENGNVKDGQDIFKNLQSAFDASVNHVEELKTSYKEEDYLATSASPPIKHGEETVSVRADVSTESVRNIPSVQSDSPITPEYETESNFEIFKSVTYEPVTIEDRPETATEETILPIYYHPRGYDGVTTPSNPTGIENSSDTHSYYQPTTSNNSAGSELTNTRNSSDYQGNADYQLPPVDDTTVTTPLINFEVSESFATTLAPFTEETFTEHNINSTDDYKEIPQKVNIRPSLVKSKHNKIPAFIVENYMRNPYLQYDNTKYATPKTKNEDYVLHNETTTESTTEEVSQQEQNSTLNTSTTESILKKHANYLAVLSKAFENIYSPRNESDEKQDQSDTTTKDHNLKHLDEGVIQEENLTELSETTTLETTTQVSETSTIPTTTTFKPYSTSKPARRSRTRGRSRFLDHHRLPYHETTTSSTVSAFEGLFQNLLFQNFAKSNRNTKKALSSQTETTAIPVQTTSLPSSDHLNELIQNVGTTTGSVSVTDFTEHLSTTDNAEDNEITTPVSLTEPTEEPIENTEAPTTTEEFYQPTEPEKLPTTFPFYGGINLNELGLTSTPSPFSKRPAIDIPATSSPDFPSTVIGEEDLNKIFNSSHLVQVLVETTTPPNAVASTTEQSYRKRPSRRRPNVRDRQFGRHRFSTELFTQKPGDQNDDKVKITDAPLHRSAAPTQADVKKISLHTTPLSSRNNRLSTKSGKTYFFNCFGKEINKFYADPRDCRLFHYCTQGYSKNQLLDLKYVCDLKTYFDDEKLICTRVKPRRCL